MSNIIEGLIENIIAIGKAINLLRPEIHENMMPFFQAMSVGMRILSFSLIILPTNQSRVNIQIRKRNRAKLLEIEVQNVHNSNPRNQT